MPPIAPSPASSPMMATASVPLTSDHRMRTRLRATRSTLLEVSTREGTGERSSCALRARSTYPIRPSCESPRDAAARVSERVVRGGSVAPSRGTHANKRSRFRESTSPVLHLDGHGSIRPAAAVRGTSYQRRPDGCSGALRIRRRWPSTRSSSGGKHPRGLMTLPSRSTVRTHVPGANSRRGVRPVGGPILPV